MKNVTQNKKKQLHKTTSLLALTKQTKGGCDSKTLSSTGVKQH